MESPNLSRPAAVLSAGILAALEHQPTPSAVLRLDDPEDPESLVILGVNAAARSLSTLDLSSVLGRRLVDALPLTQQLGRLGTYAEVARGGMAQELDLELPPDVVQMRHVRMMVWPMPDRCVGVSILDRTAHREAEDRARLFDRLVEEMPNPVRVWELPDGTEDPGALRLVAMNRANVAILPEAALGQTFAHLLSSRTSRDTAQFMVRSILEQRPFDLGEIQWRDPTGAVLTFATQCLPLGGRYAAIVAVDLTERKRAEEELAQRNADLARSNQELDRFAHVVSHDLQEPLRVVPMYAALLARRRRGQPSDSDLQSLEAITDATQRMRALIQALLSYASLGARPHRPGQVNLAALVQQVLADIDVSVQEAEAVIEVGDLPVVEADSTQLRQLYQNLLSNALKFRGEAPLRVSVGARPEADRWVLWVRDNGRGVPPDRASRIFEMFHRAHEAEGPPGSGIGLATCKRAIEAHGGSIWVESTPGEGAAFWFTLPRR